jgi:hypothetical protein
MGVVVFDSISHTHEKPWSPRGTPQAFPAKAIPSAQRHFLRKLEHYVSDAAARCEVAGSHLLRKGQVEGCARGDVVGQAQFVHRVLALVA